MQGRGTRRNADRSIAAQNPRLLLRDRSTPGPPFPLVVSQAHDTVWSDFPVNVGMERTPQMGAARAARFTSMVCSVISPVVATVALTALLGAPLPAQQDPTTTPGYRLAQAKLAEARGDVATARRTLEDALAKANDTDKAALREALAALPKDGKAPTVDDSTIQKLLDDPAATARVREVLAQRGFAAGTPQDPVQRLIAVLEQGTVRVEAVAEAMGQLEKLGALVVPPLLKTLPQVGPFGFVNAMKLLEKKNDPRIAPVLLARANSDPAFAALVVEQSQSMADGVRQALVAGIDEAKLPPGVQLQFADVMGSAPGMDERRHALVLRLADDPTVQRDLGGKLVHWQVPWADEVFAKLRASKDPAIAAGATAQWLSLQTNLDEAGALAAIQALDPRHRWWVARDVTTRSKTWAKVALLGLGEGARNKQLHQDPWFLGVEWRSGGGEAASALLQLTKTQPDLVQRIQLPIGAIIRDGWIVPPELDATLASFSASALASALPRDGEARALAAWNRLSRDDRWTFTKAIVSLGRPWHRVVAAQIAAAENASEVHEDWLHRDWTGAPPEAGAALVALAERFPRTTVVVTQGTATTSSSGRGLKWSLVDACQRCKDLPSAILLPYVREGDQFAWNVLAERDPSAALAIARAPDGPWQNVRARVLGEHGTAEDVATLVKRMGWSALSEHDLDQVRPFVLRHGLGNLALLSRMANAKVGVGVTVGPQGPTMAHDLAKQIAARVDIAQLPEYLTILPDLPNEVANRAMQSLQSQVATSHAPMLAQALAAAGARERIVAAEIRTVLNLMARSGSTECLPALRSALADARLGEHRSQVAATMVSLPGREWPAMLRELLAHPDARVVREVLVAVKPGADAELLAAATKALLANLQTLSSVDAFFDGLEPAARAATARAVLQAPDFAQASSAVANSALRALGSLKDSSHAADLARGAEHHLPSVRMAAAEQLGRLITPDAAPFLLRLLKDDDKDVRNRAKERLELLADYLDGEAKWNERLHRK
mgnify:CR=1 FL=1